MGKTPPFLARLHFRTKKVGKIFCVINEMQRLRGVNVHFRNVCAGLMDLSAEIAERINAEEMQENGRHSAVLN